MNKIYIHPGFVMNLCNSTMKSEPDRKARAFISIINCVNRNKNQRRIRGIRTDFIEVRR